VFGRTQVNDAAFRQVLPGGIFPTGVEKLYYTNVSVGLNLLPGEVFIGRNFALASSAYVIAGLGTTRFNQQRLQTFNLGGGLRVFLGEGVAVQVDARDHIYSVDLLGKRRVTQNLELTTGLTFFF
jgi:outer membrane beta-barrel protein